MTTKPPVTGRVKSIKSKFENLNSLESLDICVPTVKILPKTTKFVFNRSATSIDLHKQSTNVSLTTALSLDNRKSVRCPVRRTNEVQRQSSDSFLLKHHNLHHNRDTLKPLKEIKENVEVRLSRHTSDPIKRGSIKRSPAFRVGDTHIKGKISPVIPKEFAYKFDELLKKCVTDTQKLQESGLTDTLKAALKQPLPAGPPPKKPPRTFETPSPKDDINPLQMFNGKDFAEVIQAETKDTLLPVRTSTPNELKQKIDFLETNLVLNSSNLSATNRSNSAVKEKSLLSNSFLSCIPCSSPIYDSVVAKSIDSRPKQKPEPIYMEPFIHFKSKPNSKVPEEHNKSANEDRNKGLSNNDASDSKPLKNESENCNSSVTSCASCAENHPNDHGDIHYMVSFYFYFLFCQK